MLQHDPLVRTFENMKGERPRQYVTIELQTVLRHGLFFAQSVVYFDRPFCPEDMTHGSDGAKFSAAHCRAKRLSSAAVYKLSLCLIFSQCVSMVLRLRWNCSAISRGLYAAPNNRNTCVSAS